MPVYLFTLHAYASWLPDHPMGYTRRKQGINPPNTTLAQHYRANMAAPPARFEPAAQKTIIDAVLEKAAIKNWTTYAVANDPSHTHILLSWQTPAPPLDIQRGLKSSITRQLNAHLCKQKWLAERGSRKPVKDQQHFAHLLHTYLPEHRGLVWIAPKYRK